MNTTDVFAVSHLFYLAPLLIVRAAAQPQTAPVTLMIDTPITLSTIASIHTVVTETGENGSVLQQLITPPTPALDCAAQCFLGPFGVVGDHFRVGCYRAAATVRRQLLVERHSS